MWAVWIWDGHETRYMTPDNYQDGSVRCSWFSCTNRAIVREAWFDDPDDVPSFASGEVAYCAEHMEKGGEFL